MALKGRGEILNSIPSLKVEWVTDYPNLSIRDFLMNKKAFTERQYRSVIASAPLAEWEAYRKEIREKISVTKIRTHVNLITDTNNNCMKAASLGIALAVKALHDKTELTPKEKLTYMRMIETSQKIFHTALGIGGDSGRVQVQVNNSLQMGVATTEVPRDHVVLSPVTIGTSEKGKL